jgi:MFS family permease
VTSDLQAPPIIESKTAAVGETARRRSRMDAEHPHYKWVALSNTTLGALLASINSSIVLISLPAIFRGIGLNPLAPGNVSYLLWMLMGYLVVTAVLVVPLGRLGDIFGRVRGVLGQPGAKRPRRRRVCAAVVGRVRAYRPLRLPIPSDESRDLACCFASSCSM